MVYAAPIEEVNEIATIGGFSGLVQNIIAALLGLAGIALFVMLLSGGFTYLTSGGDPKQVEAAKGTISHAILGLVLIAVSFLVLVFIQFFTGAPVTNFAINVP